MLTFSRKSSSFHTLNHDNFYKYDSDGNAIASSIWVKLKITQFSWLLINYLLNILDLTITKFYLHIKKEKKSSYALSTPMQIDLKFKYPELPYTPARYLVNEYLQSHDWSREQSNLGKEINFFDIGCRDGAYLEKLSNLIASNIRYTGVDLVFQESWSQLREKYINSDFFCLHGANMGDVLSKADPNFIFSIACLEHVDQDISVLELLCNYASNSKHKVKQIHIVPAAKSLFLNGPHGIRVYSPFLIKRLIRPAQMENLNVAIHNLGGVQAAELHKNYVGMYSLLGARSTDKRSNNPTRYQEKLVEAAISDRQSGTDEEPLLYSIEINNF